MFEEFAFRRIRIRRGFNGLGAGGGGHLADGLDDVAVFKGVEADDLAVLVLHGALGNDAVAVIGIFIDVLDIAGIRDDLFGGPVIEVILGGDRGGALGLNLAVHRAVVVIGVLDGVGVGDGSGGGVDLVSLDGLQDVVLIVVGIIGDFTGFGHGSGVQETGLFVINIDDVVASVGRDPFDSAKLVQRLDHLLETAAVCEDIFPEAVGFLAVVLDRLQRTGLGDAGLVGKGLGAAGDNAVVKMEGGGVGRLAEVVFLFLVEMLDPIGGDAVGFTLLDHITGEALAGGNGVGARRLGNTVHIGIGQSVVPGDLGAEVAVLIDALDQDRAAGLVVLDADGLADPVPGELPDLILDGLLGDLHDFGIQKVLDAGCREDLVEDIEIAGVLNALQLLEGLQLSGLIAPDKGVRIDGLQRRGKDHASQPGEVHEGVGGDLRDVALENHAGDLILQVGPGGGILLAEGGHLASAADDQGAGPLVIEIREAGADHLDGAAGGGGGAVGDRTGGVDFHRDLHGVKVNLVPFVGELVPAVGIAPPVPVSIVAVLFAPVPLPVFSCGAGGAVHGGKADHHADDQENGQKNSQLFHCLNPLYNNFIKTLR